MELLVVDLLRAGDRVLQGGPAHNEVVLQDVFGLYVHELGVPQATVFAAGLCLDGVLRYALLRMHASPLEERVPAEALLVVHHARLDGRLRLLPQRYTRPGAVAGLARVSEVTLLLLMSCVPLGLQAAELRGPNGTQLALRLLALTHVA